MILACLVTQIQILMFKKLNNFPIRDQCYDSIAQVYLHGLGFIIFTNVSVKLTITIMISPSATIPVTIEVNKQAVPTFSPLRKLDIVFSIDIPSWSPGNHATIIKPRPKYLLFDHIILQDT